MKIQSLYKSAVWLASAALLLPAASQAATLGDTVKAVDFDQESHLSDQNTIRKINQNHNTDHKVGYIKNNTWIKFEDFDFAGGASSVLLNSATATNSENITIRLGSHTGTLIGTITLPETGSTQTFDQFTASIDETKAHGIKDVVFVFSGGFYKQDFRSFKFEGANTEDINVTYPADAFDDESHPGDNGNVRDLNTTNSQNTNIGYLNQNTWIKYNNFNFGTSGADSLTVQAATSAQNIGFSVRLDNPGGEEIAWVDINQSNGPNDYDPNTTYSISSKARGVRDLFFVFETGGELNLKNFKFNLADSDVGKTKLAVNFDQESHPNNNRIIRKRQTQNRVSNTKANTWIRFDDFDLGKGPASVTISGSSPYGDGRGVELRLGSHTGTLISTVDFNNTMGYTNFEDFDAQVTPHAEGIHDLYVVFPKNGPSIRSLTFNWEPAGLHVYPPVPGLTPSPKYSFRVREVGATIWKTPFAFFTECEDYDKIGDEPDYISGNPSASNPKYLKDDGTLKNPNTHKTAYYASYIGSWSNTYCNFEMAENTPIEVEITRIDGKNMISANVHPADKVTSSTRNGNVLTVTLDNPGLFTVDVNDMDGNNMPRARIEWNDNINDPLFPYRTPATAIHTFTIFANPFIVDKPKLNGPGVHMVEPGNRPNPGPNDTVVYFKPGVHDIIAPGNGQANFRYSGNNSPIPFENGMSYYIPGDALIHGNFMTTNGWSEDDVHDVRVYGYGTISGERIPHYKDLTPTQRASGFNDEHGDFDGDKKIRLNSLALHNTHNSKYEGITLIDQPYHGIMLWNNYRSYTRPANFARWLKLLSWRVNTDGVTASDNGYVEDCFIRHQDDATYVRGMGFSRVVTWSDVNGTIRGELITTTFNKDTPKWALDQGMIVEDIDVIYARSVFNWTDYPVIHIPGTNQGNKFVKDGPNGALVENTGQYLTYRNINIEDPSPQKVAFNLNRSLSGNLSDEIYDTAGVLFQNVSMAEPQVWGNRSTLNGISHSHVRSITFDNFTIDGDWINDLDEFEDSPSSYTYDILFQ